MASAFIRSGRYLYFNMSGYDFQCGDLNFGKARPGPEPSLGVTNEKS